MEEGNFYHIYNRGNNRERIFFEERNYIHFLKLFDKYLSSLTDVYAYCLMPNHFHFLIRVKEQTQTSEVFKTSDVYGKDENKKMTLLEKGFKDFFISYSKAINKAYNRTGSLFQPKFKKREITDNAYFTDIIQYIHANPLKANLCKHYSQYTFSSYNAIAGTGHTKIMRQEVIDWFGNREQFIKIHEERKLDIEKVKQIMF